MPIIKWDIEREEHDLVIEIAQRVLREYPSYPDTQATLMMDLTATHANGSRLKLRELLEAPKQDFFHDVFGIRRHLNRRTGKLENCFLPRYAA